MSSPVAHLHQAASIRKQSELFASAHRQRAEQLSGKPRPGHLFGSGRMSRSGTTRSERQVMDSGALRSDPGHVKNGRPTIK